MDPTKDDLPSAPAFPSLEENPSKDYWAFKKKRRREKEHSAEETPKAPKLEEGSSPSEPRPSDDTTQKRNWKNLEISEIPFFSPTIAVDCSFEEQMSHKRIRSLALQLKYSYASLKKHERPCRLEFVGLKPGSLVHQALEKHDGFESWKVFKQPLPVEEAYPIEKIVYLSPDSENLIETIDEDKVYVIGGIVDDNQLKGLSLSKAKKFGIAHGKLPIKDHLASFNNQSLNINHIVEILLSLGQGKAIKEALEAAVPQRYVAPKVAWRSKNAQSADKKPEFEEGNVKEMEE